MHILRFILYYVLLRWSFVYEMYLFPRDTSFHAPMMEICDVQGCKSNGIDTLLSAEKIDDPSRRVVLLVFAKKRGTVRVFGNNTK